MQFIQDLFARIAWEPTLLAGLRILIVLVLAWIVIQVLNKCLVQAVCTILLKRQQISPTGASDRR